MVCVKICGITTAEAFDATVEAGADWIGFNFFPPSPRFVQAKEAAALSARVEGGPLRVGLFVDPTIEDIAAVVADLKLDILQLYGKSLPLADIKVRFGLPIWRPIGVETAADLPTDNGGADALLMEAKPPPEATRPGGNAVSFDWTLLKGWQAPAPWLLAGGLTPDNVVRAIRETGATAVDVSSGVERSRGVKDPVAIRAFVARARGGG